MKTSIDTRQLGLVARGIALVPMVALLLSEPASAQQGGFYRMKLGRFYDRYGFAQPVEAGRILVPANWRFDGGVQWGPPTGCLHNLIQVSARGQDASGAYGIEIFTPYTWQWHDDPQNRAVVTQQSQYLNAAIRPCQMMGPIGAVDFIRQFVIPRHRRGARVMGAEPLPQVAAVRQQQLYASVAHLIQARLVSGVRVDAGRVLISYPVNGRQVEEWIMAIIETTAAPAMSATAVMSGGLSQVNSYTITASGLIATRAPQGELNRYSKMYASMIGSIRINAHWAIAVQKVFTEIGKGALDEATKRARIWAEVSTYTGNIITETYRAQQATQDRLANSFSQSIRGTQTYFDPTTRERVELTGGYTQAWSNGRGEYILSDDPNFNPAVALREQWTELVRSN